MSAIWNSPAPMAAICPISWGGWSDARAAPPPAEPDRAGTPDPGGGAAGVFAGGLYRHDDGCGCRRGGPVEADAVFLLRVEGGAVLGDDARPARPDDGCVRASL